MGAWGFGVMLVLWRRARDRGEEDGGERVRIKAPVFARLSLSSAESPLSVFLSDERGVCVFSSGFGLEGKAERCCFYRGKSLFI